LAARATHLAIYARRDKEALEAAALWVKSAPADLEARQALAAMYIRHGKVNDALRELEFVLASQPGSRGQKLRQIANFLGREPDKATALKVMEQLVAKRQDDPDALFAYALLAIRADEVEKAREAMETVIEMVPPNSSIAMAYLSILRKQNDLPAALQWLESTLKQHPGEFDLRMVYARLLADARRFDEAHEQFEMLAVSAPDNADVQYALGLLNIQANRLDKARENFTTLVQKGHRVNEASYYLGQIAEAGEDYEKALKWYKAVDSGANYFDAQIKIALVLARQEKIEEAYDHLHGIRANGKEQRMQVVRVEGEILTELGKYTQAMAIYDEALGDDYDADLLYTRAILAEKMGQVDRMERDLRRILDREPDNAQVLNALGYTLADQTDRHEEAYELIKRAHQLSPDDFYILDSMGWVLYRLGRLEEAVRYLRQARAIRDDPEVAAHLSEVLWMMGDKEGARTVWESALKTTPGDQNLLDVIKRLSR
jgi:tetratricopeptide (TPR) repeat protein